MDKRYTCKLEENKMRRLEKARKKLEEAIKQAEKEKEKENTNKQ